MAGEGLVSMTPSSIAHSGTSASINADGGVDFTAVSELSLNGVFTSNYDNYVLNIRHTGSGADALNLRLRLSGSDASGSDYVNQELLVSDTTRSPVRSAATTRIRIGAFDTGSNGCQVCFYGPSLAEPTATRSVSVDSTSTVRFYWIAATHSASTAYDGLTLYRNGATETFTGNVHVFGYEE